MSFDPLIANAGRLQILTALAVEERQEFVCLRRSTQMTDGNLACHARRLESAGLVAIDKQFRDGKPVTQFTLTANGRTALEAHTRRLIAAISHRRLAPIAQQAPQELVAKELATESVAVVPAPSEEDWVD